jgi:WD40 repeat protein
MARPSPSVDVRRDLCWKGGTRDALDRPDPIVVRARPPLFVAPIWADLVSEMANANDPTRARPGWLWGVGGWLLVVLTILAGAAVVETAWRADPESPIDGDERAPAQAARFDLRAPVWLLAFSPDGTKLASSTIADDVWLMDDSSGALAVPRRGPMNGVRSLVFSPDGRVLAVGGSGRTVRLVDTSTASDLGDLQPDGEDNASHVAISADGRYLAAGGSCGTVTIWDRRDQRRLGAMAGQAPITALGFAPDGSALAAGDVMGRVWLWAVPARTRRILLAADAPHYGVTALAFSPDGRSLASASALEGCVRLWDPSDGRPLATISQSPGHVRALAFSPDGALLAIAQADGSAALWGLAEGRELARVQANRSALQSVAFSADGRSFAIGGTDGCVRLWDRARAVGERTPAALR